MPPDHVIQIFQSSAAWWQAWLPVLGSVLVAGVALWGVVVSNRTNRDAIAAADERALMSWRRDEVLKVVLSVLETSDDILQEFRYQHSWTAEYAKKDNELKRKTDKLSLNYSSLELLAPGALPSRCKELHEALFNAREAVVNLQEVRARNMPELFESRVDAQTKEEDAKAARTNFIQAAQAKLGTSDTFTPLTAARTTTPRCRLRWPRSGTAAVQRE
ncbi:hypothetical protein [Nocardia sp. MH4]|uniref:hypothetical protein n=1 Tax=Nocardia sp. MH4 TaxID=1768677 RepID=UPI001C4E3185|nr:hypothetical protein [Nocardia sp. MH4]